MGKVLEATSMFLLGILLILGMTHFLNGTLLQWIASKFYVGTPQQAAAQSTIDLRKAWLKVYENATPEQQKSLLQQWNSGTWKP